MNGWVRNTVSTFMSSCEWCTSWKRQSIRTRWFAKWANQLHPSIATKITAIAPQLGTVPILARTSQGRDLSTTSAKERVSAVTSGTVSVAFNSV